MHVVVIVAEPSEEAEGCAVALRRCLAKGIGAHALAPEAIEATAVQRDWRAAYSRPALWPDRTEVWLDIVPVAQTARRRRELLTVQRDLQPLVDANRVHVGWRVGLTSHA